MTDAPPSPSRPYADSVTTFLAAQPVALYRHFDQRGELLYVGITLDPVTRWEQHHETSLWARFVAQSYLTWHHDRASARAAEKVAIKIERPIFNAQRPDAKRANEIKIRYLRTGMSGLFRRVPCRPCPGEFCIDCGPDREASQAERFARIDRELGIA